MESPDCCVCLEGAGVSVFRLYLQGTGSMAWSAPRFECCHTSARCSVHSLGDAGSSGVKIWEFPKIGDSNIDPKHYGPNGKDTRKTG